jgi:hypothetical protein
MVNRDQEANRGHTANRGRVRRLHMVSLASSRRPFNPQEMYRIIPTVGTSHRRILMTLTARETRLAGVPVGQDPQEVNTTVLSTIRDLLLVCRLSLIRDRPLESHQAHMGLARLAVRGRAVVEQEVAMNLQANPAVHFRKMFVSLLLLWDKTSWLTASK